jgi:hypothetical protein
MNNSITYFFDKDQFDAIIIEDTYVPRVGERVFIDFAKWDYGDENWINKRNALHNTHWVVKEVTHSVRIGYLDNRGNTHFLVPNRQHAEVFLKELRSE